MTECARYSVLDGESVTYSLHYCVKVVPKVELTLCVWGKCTKTQRVEFSRESQTEL